MTSVRFSLPLRSLLLAATASLAWPAMAATEQPVDSAATSSDEDTIYDDRDSSEIVVTAPRLAGQLDTRIAAEVELDEAAIASYGVSSVEDLITALAPQTRSGRGRGSGRPIILVNGRRISGFGAIRNLPPEAIVKVEVFPEQVALEYGYAADERVVNLVLKPDFKQISLEDEAGLATQGGRFRNELQPAFTSIGKNGRINIDSRWETNGMLLESERDLIPVAGTAADASARSLLPQSDKYVVDGTLVRNIDKLTEASINLRFDQTDSLSLLGPGAGGVADPLRRNSRDRNLTSSASINGMMGNWRWSVTGNYADSDSRILTDQISGGRDSFDSSSQSFGVNGNVSGTLTEGWAGPVQLTFTPGYSGLRYDSRSERAGIVTSTRLSRDLPGALGIITVPLLDPDYDVGHIGTVTLTLNGQIQEPSDFATLKSWGASLNWGLTKNFSVLASYASDEAAPSVTQLGAAPLVTPLVNYYDFATGQTVQISTTTGGNPALLAEQRRDFGLGLNWSPPMVEGLNLSINYNSNRSFDTSNAFPILTPEIEAAFPGRVTRDGNGVLQAVDLRPVNYDRATNSQIRWGFNFGRSFGQPETGAGGRGDGGGARPQRPDGPPPGGRSPDGKAPPADGAAPPDGNAPQSGEGGAPPPRPAAGGRGGGGRIPFGNRQGGRWQVSLYHTIKLTDQVLIRPGVPELDLLNGSATGSDGGSNRHLFELDGGVFYKGVGARISARYDSGSRVNGGLTGGDLKFGDLATINMRFFMNLDSKAKLIAAAPFLKGSRLRLSVNNLFDAQRRVTDGTGVVPIRYQADYLDPLGRYVELELRKSF